ncbi:MAG: glutamine amidotransferase [Phycisphaerae bacterium]
MASISLQFRGTGNFQLLWTLAVLVCAAVVVWGVVQLVKGRRRYGLICLSAAGGPVTLVAALLIDAGVSYARGRSRSAGRSLLAAAGLALPVPLLIGLLTLSGAAIPWQHVLGAGLLSMGVAGAIGVFYASVYAYLGTGRMAALMALRFGGVLSLMLLLFLPALSLLDEDDTRKPYLAIVLDRSASMATTDGQNMPERYAHALQMLRTQQERLGRGFRPVYYHFARSLQSSGSLGDLAELRPGGEGTDGTNLAHALRSAAADFPPSDLAGVVLITDGVDNVNTAPDVRIASVEARVPVYPVGVGSRDETLSGRRNLRIVSADAPMEVVVDNVATIGLQARLSGFAGRFFKVRLLDAATGDVLASRDVTTDKNAQTVPLELKWTPKRTGGGDAASAVRKLKLAIEPDAAETNPDDNDLALHVRLSEPRVRVLYIEGSMRPEYRALKRLLMTDSNVQFMGLVRVDRNRFWGQGRIDGRQLSGLPTTDSDFRLFDVIILGDVDATFLKTGGSARLRRLGQFVRDGGGLLMLGGRNSFGPGGYGGTEVEKVLPVEVGDRQAEQEMTAFVPQTTAAGEIHPILEGITGFFPGPGGREAAEGMPELEPLKGCVTLPRAKGGAKVLMVHPTRRNAAGPLTVLAVNEVVGKGRTAAMTIDTTYQWDGPMRAAGLPSPYPRLWGQLVRWLAGVDTKSRRASPDVLLRLERTYLQVGERLGIRARVWDPEGTKLDKPRVLCSVSHLGGGGSEEITLVESRVAGVWEADFTPRTDGRYRVTVRATDAAGEKELGSDSIEVQVAPQSAETERLARNDRLLEQIAEHSGGRYVQLAGLPELADHVTKLQAGRAGVVAEARLVQLYNFPLLFVLFVAFITAEWVLRRRWQLQ